MHHFSATVVYLNVNYIKGTLIFTMCMDDIRTFRERSLFHAMGIYTLDL